MQARVWLLGLLAVLGCSEGTGERPSTGRTPAVSSEDRIPAGGVFRTTFPVCRAWLRYRKASGA